MEKLVGENIINVNHSDEVTASLKSEIKRLRDMNSKISEEITDFETELTKNKRRVNIISSSLVNYRTKIQSMADDKMDKELSELTYIQV